MIFQALIDEVEAKKLKDSYKLIEKAITNQKWTSAFDFLNRMIVDLRKFTNWVNLYNFLRWDKKEHTFNGTS
jgi:hypothetical protein